MAHILLNDRSQSSESADIAVSTMGFCAPAQIERPVVTHTREVFIETTPPRQATKLLMPGSVLSPSSRCAIADSPL